ncbi:restriction endonuclease [Candidatus Poribacteria bacterium]|nr:restriction endonuclease [Candidatus Poribacteria bacterium]
MKNYTPTQYEKIVHELFSTELAKHVNLSDFKMFHDKKYLGKSGHEHQIDVSAELKIAGVKVLILIECKRYAHRVGIDDVMEVATRLDDIGAHKGILVTTEGFQGGAVKMAKSKGIALVKACDLGWFPRYEHPAAAMIRHKGFRKIAEAFLRWYLGPDAKQETIDNAVNPDRMRVLRCRIDKIPIC